jgi:hypothetical protein
MIHQAKMLRELGLSEEQKKAVRSVLDGERETLTRQLTGIAEQHRGLEVAIGRGAPEAELREKAAALGRLYGDVAVTRAGLMAKFNALLTDKQKLEAAKLQADDDKRDEAERVAFERTLMERIEKGGGLSMLDRP